MFLTAPGALMNVWVRFLSGMLPAAMWSVIAAAALLIAIPYWALEKQFQEQEIATQIVNPALDNLW